MVTIKEATENAIAFATAAMGPERTAGIRLEEIASGHEGSEEVWLITLSLPASEAGLALAAVMGAVKRDYKTFTVQKRTGEVTSMKIRELANA